MQAMGAAEAKVSAWRRVFGTFHKTRRGGNEIALFKKNSDQDVASRSHREK